MLYKNKTNTNNKKTKIMKTYNVHFNDSNDSNDKGFRLSFADCRNWIDCNKDDHYFKAYKGGTVSIICNETGACYYEETIE